MKNNIVEIANKVIANTYSRFPIVIIKGKGCVVEDVTGKEYIDFIAGIAVCNLGHAHPEVQAVTCISALNICDNEGCTQQDYERLFDEMIDSIEKGFHIETLSICDGDSSAEMNDRCVFR